MIHLCLLFSCVGTTVPEQEFERECDVCFSDDGMFVIKWKESISC